MKKKKSILLLHCNRPFCQFFFNWLKSVRHVICSLRICLWLARFFFVKCRAWAALRFLKSVLLTSSFQSCARYWLGWWQDQHVVPCWNCFFYQMLQRCLPTKNARAVAPRVTVQTVGPLCAILTSVNKCGLGNFFYVKRSVGTLFASCVHSPRCTAFRSCVLTQPRQLRSIVMPSCLGAD